MRSSEVLALLKSYESRNVTCIESDGSWPIVWSRAKGAHVWDAEGKRYLDLTAAFGVAAAGHSNPRVVRAGQMQMGKLMHAMGDVHPHELKARLARKLSRLTFERWGRDGLSGAAGAAKSGGIRRRTPNASRDSDAPYADKPGRDWKWVAKATLANSHRKAAEGCAQSKTLREVECRERGEHPHLITTGKTIFCNSGFEAVEAALKTAMLATGKRGVIAFEGAYHGLGYGALNVTHRSDFRSPFQTQLAEFGIFLPFPANHGSSSNSLEKLGAKLEQTFRKNKIGAVLVEPIQGRGGINVPAPGFLNLLRECCDRHGALLMLDEIYTGFGRTGAWFACEHSGVVPDLLCLGKALAGGFPISACVGRAELMDAAWPRSAGEALHTSTFLGHPVGCAMALAQIQEIESRKLVERSAELGQVLLDALESETVDSKFQISCRGLGLLAGVELRRTNGTPAGPETMQVVKRMLKADYILLPEGEHGNVIGFTPPLMISRVELLEATRVLGKLLRQARAGSARGR